MAKGKKIDSGEKMKPIVENPKRLRQNIYQGRKIAGTAAVRILIKGVSMINHSTEVPLLF
jgi:hypothetical protein